MRRFLIISVAAVFVPVAAGGSYGAESFDSDGLASAACIIMDHSAETLEAALDILKGGGARDLHIFPPHVVFGRMPDASRLGELSMHPVQLVRAPSEIPQEEIGPILSRVIKDLFRKEEIFAAAAPLIDAPIDDRVIRVPREILISTAPSRPQFGAPSEIVERGIDQNSEFLIGTILINVILPESQVYGGEDWTDDEIAEVISGIALGVSQYQQKAYWIDTEMDFKYNFENFVRAAVSIDPIVDGGMGIDNLWINEALVDIGYEIDPKLTVFERIHALNNDTRDEFKADWVFTAFIVDMSEHYDPAAMPGDPGCWRGAGYVAYAMLGGPYMVMPHPACYYGYGLGFGQVFIHEMSHIFWALDEYPQAEAPCTAKTGYLAVRNMNTLFYPCQETVPCIMQSGRKSQPLPFCAYTLGQVGITDDNDNSKIDIYERPPLVVFKDRGEGGDTITSDIYLMSVVAKSQAVENENPFQEFNRRIYYAPKLSRGFYMLNGAMSFELSGSRWNKTEVDLDFFINNLDPGRTTIEFWAENEIGIKSEVVQENIYRLGLKYYNVIAIPDENNMIDVSWMTGGEVFGAVFDIFRRDLTAGSEEEIIATIYEPTEDGWNRNYYSYKDRDVEPSHLYKYRIIGSFRLGVGGEVKDFQFETAGIEVRAGLPVGNDIISYLLPNPTRGSTMFTVMIPESYEDITGKQGAYSGERTLMAPALVRTVTPVDIGVYNVSGQRVHTIYSGWRLGGLITLIWEGVDRHGRQVAQGVYFIRVKAGDRTTVRKIIILR